MACYYKLKIGDETYKIDLDLLASAGTSASVWNEVFKAAYQFSLANSKQIKGFNPLEQTKKYTVESLKAIFPDVNFPTMSVAQNLGYRHIFVKTEQELEKILKEIGKTDLLEQINKGKPAAFYEAENGIGVTLLYNAGFTDDIATLKDSDKAYAQILNSIEHEAGHFLMDDMVDKIALSAQSINHPQSQELFKSIVNMLDNMRTDPTVSKSFKDATFGKAEHVFGKGGDISLYNIKELFVELTTRGSTAVANIKGESPTLLNTLIEYTGKLMEARDSNVFAEKLGMSSVQDMQSAYDGVSIPVRGLIGGMLFMPKDTHVSGLENIKLRTTEQSYLSDNAFMTRTQPALGPSYQATSQSSSQSNDSPMDQLNNFLSLEGDDFKRGVISETLENVSPTPAFYHPMIGRHEYDQLVNETAENIVNELRSFLVGDVGLTSDESLEYLDFFVAVKLRKESLDTVNDVSDAIDNILKGSASVLKDNVNVLINYLTDIDKSLNNGDDEDLPFMPVHEYLMIEGYNPLEEVKPDDDDFYQRIATAYVGANPYMKHKYNAEYFKEKATKAMEIFKDRTASFNKKGRGRFERSFGASVNSPNEYQMDNLVEGDIVRVPYVTWDGKLGKNVPLAVGEDGKMVRTEWSDELEQWVAPDGYEMYYVYKPVLWTKDGNVVVASGGEAKKADAKKGIRKGEMFAFTQEIPFELVHSYRKFIGDFATEVNQSKEVLERIKQEKASTYREYSLFPGNGTVNISHEQAANLPKTWKSRNGVDNPAFRAINYSKDLTVYLPNYERFTTMAVGNNRSLISNVSKGDMVKVDMMEAKREQNKNGEWVDVKENGKVVYEKKTSWYPVYRVMGNVVELATPKGGDLYVEFENVREIAFNRDADRDGTFMEDLNQEILELKEEGEGLRNQNWTENERGGYDVDDYSNVRFDREDDGYYSTQQKLPISTKYGIEAIIEMRAKGADNSEKWKKVKAALKRNGLELEDDEIVRQINIAYNKIQVFKHAEKGDQIKVEYYDKNEGKTKTKYAIVYAVSNESVITFNPVKGGVGFFESFGINTVEEGHRILSYAKNQRYIKDLVDTRAAELEENKDFYKKKSEKDNPDAKSLNQIYTTKTHYDNQDIARLKRGDMVVVKYQKKDKSFGTMTRKVHSVSEDGSKIYYADYVEKAIKKEKTAKERGYYIPAGPRLKGVDIENVEALMYHVDNHPGLMSARLRNAHNFRQRRMTDMKIFKSEETAKKFFNKTSEYNKNKNIHVVPLMNVDGEFLSWDYNPKLGKHEFTVVDKKNASWTFAFAISNNFRGKKDELFYDENVPERQFRYNNTEGVITPSKYFNNHFIVYKDDGNQVFTFRHENISYKLVAENDGSRTYELIDLDTGESVDKSDANAIMQDFVSKSGLDIVDRVSGKLKSTFFTLQPTISDDEKKSILKPDVHEGVDYSSVSATVRIDGTEYKLLTGAASQNFSDYNVDWFYNNGKMETALLHLLTPEDGITVEQGDHKGTYSFESFETYIDKDGNHQWKVNVLTSSGYKLSFPMDDVTHIVRWKGSINKPLEKKWSEFWKSKGNNKTKIVGASKALAISEKVRTDQPKKKKLSRKQENPIVVNDSDEDHNTGVSDAEILAAVEEDREQERERKKKQNAQGKGKAQYSGKAPKSGNTQSGKEYTTSRKNTAEKVAEVKERSQKQVEENLKILQSANIAWSKNVPGSLHNIQGALRLARRMEALHPDIKLHKMDTAGIKRFDNRPEFGYAKFSNAKAFVLNGEIYLNLDLVSTDDVLHEYGHVFLANVKKNDLSLYMKLIEKVKGHPEYFKRKKYYSELSESDLLEETFVAVMSDQFAREIAISKDEENDIDRYVDSVKEAVEVNSDNVLDLTLDEVMAWSSNQILNKPVSSYFNTLTKGSLSDYEVRMSKLLDLGILQKISCNGV